MAYCFQSGHPLGFAVQLRLTPELKQALINARASGEAVSLRFREEPHREAILSVAGQEYFFSTAPQAGQVEVVEVAHGSRLASSVATIKQRLTLQRPVDADARPRGLAGSLGLAGSRSEDRRKRSAVLLEGSQRGGGMQARVTTTTTTTTTTLDAATRPIPPQIQQQPQQPQPSLGNGAVGGAPGSRVANGSSSMAATLGGGGGGGSAAPSLLRATHGSAPRSGTTTLKPMELPRPRSQQPGSGGAAGGAAAKPPPLKARNTPTPPPPDTGAATGPQPDSRPGSGGGGSGGGSSPVGYGTATAAPPPQPPPASVELPRAAVFAARRGDLPLVVAALLRDQPLTASSLQSRIDQAYRAAAAKPEAREYVKRVIDNCCSMSANRMHLRPDVIAREGPRLEELLSGTSPTAGTDAPNGTGERGRGTSTGAGPGRYGNAFGQGAAAKRMASCSPDPPSTSPSDHQQRSPRTGLQGASGGGGGGRSSTEDAAAAAAAAAASGGTGFLGGIGEEDDDGGSQLQNGAQQSVARGNSGGGARQQGSNGAKRQKTSGGGPGSAGQAPPPPPSSSAQQYRLGTGNGCAAGRGVGGGGAAAGNRKLRGGYDDFDDLADPMPLASAPPPSRETSGGRPTGQRPHPGRAAAAKAAAAAAAAKPKKIVPAPGGPSGLPSHAQLAPLSSSGGASQASQPQRPPLQQPKAPTLRSRPAPGSGGGGAADGGGSRESPSPVRRAEKDAPAKAATEAAAANCAAGVARPHSALTGSEDGGGTGGGGGVASAGGGSESRMDTDGRGTTLAATTTTGVTASPDYESALDPEIQAYADLDLELQEDDKDAAWYLAYVDWKPELHAAVQSAEQYEQYEREYRHKFEVYHRLNQKYAEVVREADACRAAVDAARGPDERHRCVLALWRLGAAKWKLLEVWKRARRNLHSDLGDLRDRVAEYMTRQRGATSAKAQLPPPQPQLQLQLQQS